MKPRIDENLSIYLITKNKKSGIIYKIISTDILEM
jgi:hypothetical protein